VSIETEMSVLKRLSFFACLPEEQLRSLVFGSERLRLGQGKILYNEGDAADCAYVLLGGQIDLYYLLAQAGPDGRQRQFRRVISAVKAGAALGLFALISDKQRETGAYMAKRGDVLRINRASFRRQLKRHEEMRRALSAHVFSNFQAMIFSLEQRLEKWSIAA